MNNKLKTGNILVNNKGICAIVVKYDWERNTPLIQLRPVDSEETISLKKGMDLVLEVDSEFIKEWQPYET